MKEDREKQFENVLGYIITACVAVIPFLLGLLFDNIMLGMGFGVLGGIVLTIGAIILSPSERGFIFLLPFAGVALGGFAYIFGLIGSGIGNIYRDGNMIKGNIQYETHEKIYHVPGCSHYEDTEIEPMDGERWFSSESDARAAGWRECYDR